jgi:hypothetical protein
MPQTMLDDHNVLRALAGELERLLDAAREQTAEIARTRWTLARHLLRHLAQEPAVLARLTADRPIANLVAQHSQGRAAQLRDEVERHLREWSSERIFAFFPLFKVELRRLLRVIDETMRFEETVLYAAPHDYSRTAA